MRSEKLNHMRAFAAAWPDRAIMQEVLAQLPWRQNIVLPKALDDQETRLRGCLKIRSVARARAKSAGARRPNEAY